MANKTPPVSPSPASADKPASPRIGSSPKFRPDGYGVTSFESVRKKNFCFVDNTRWLLDIDRSYHTAVMLRPSGFGKSLFLSMMRAYFCKSYKADEWAKLFDGLDCKVAVEKARAGAEAGHATSSVWRPMANSMYVLHIVVPTEYDDMAIFRTKLYASLDASLMEFCRCYGFGEFAATDKSIELTLQRVITRIAEDGPAEDRVRAGEKLLVLVDEYDRAVVHALRKSADDQEAAKSVVRELLSTLKTLSGRSGVRFFVTGILPLNLSESVFNKAQQLHMMDEFANMLGFSEEQVKAVLRDVAGVDLDRPEGREVLDVVRAAYNGYVFSGASESVYNPQLVMYFAEGYATGRIDIHCAEHLCSKQLAVTYTSSFGNLTDINLRVSRTQIRLVLQTSAMIELLMSFAIEEWAENQDVVCHTVSERYSLAAHAGVDGSTSCETAVASHFYFLGLLTLAEPGMKTGDASAVRLRVPNRVIFNNFISVLLGHVRNPGGVADRFAKRPSVDTLAELLESLAPLVKDTHNYHEADLQAILYGAFVFRPAYAVDTVPVRSEVQEGKAGRCDLVVFAGAADVDIADEVLIMMELKVITRKCKGRKVTEEGWEAMSGVSLEDDDLRGVPISFKQGKESFRTVGELHKKAEGRASGYVKHETDPEKTPTRKVIGFAVTQVVDRFLITEVQPPIAIATPQAP